MKNYKMTVLYDGTHYKGWQIQKSTSDTIQGKLSDILLKLTSKPVEVIGSGRTDAGVHSIGQTANFHADIPEGMSVSDLQKYINAYLPEDIAVTSLEEADDRFHARFDAASKTYRYRIYVGDTKNVFERKYVYSYKEAVLDAEAMRRASQYLLGKHDFKAFCGNKHMKNSTVRTVTDIRIEETSDEIAIYFEGDGFLQNMVRIMTGTLIEAGTGIRTPESVEEALKSLDRTRAGFKVPPQGLCLMEVRY